MNRSEFQSFDGRTLSYRRVGEGRPVIMLHGFLANSRFNWIDPGIADAIAGAGFEAIMLDLRGHGRSAMPEDASAYPPDVLALDGMAFIAHLGVSDYDLVGYSLGARTGVRMLLRGAKPRRCVLGGMGASGIIGSAARVSYFEDAITKAEAGEQQQGMNVVARMIERAHLNPRVMLHVLKSQVSTPEADLSAITTPTLVVSGSDDNDNGSAEDLAKLLPNAKAQRTPGNHLSAVQDPQLAQAIVHFLTE